MLATQQDAKKTHTLIKKSGLTKDVAERERESERERERERRETEIERDRDRERQRERDRQTISGFEAATVQALFHLGFGR